MKVLSLFDGISCGRVALDRAGVPVEAYYASEIDKYAMAISAKNYPDIVQVGDVQNILPKNKLRESYHHKFTPKLNFAEASEIDLLIGGSPCQDLSIAKKDRKGLSGERSGLFWEYVRILKEVKPRYFILENVNSMPKQAKQLITETLGVEPIMINAALVSAQNRKRLFWTNIPNVVLPEDRGVLLKDILESGDGDLKSYCVPSTYYKENIKSLIKRKKTGLTVRLGSFNSGGQGDRVYSPEGKTVGLSALGGGRGAKTGLYLVEDSIRKLTPKECERLQSLPDNYTESISNSQRYKCLGNAFNVDVVAHILSFIPELLPLNHPIEG